MKYSYVLIAAVGLAAAQKKFTDVIPECSVKCLTDAVKAGTKCSSIDDSKCICEPNNYRSIYNVGVQCVLVACDPEVATRELLPAAGQFCREVTGQAVSSAASSASAAVSSVVSSASASAAVSSASAAASSAASVATSAASVAASASATASSAATSTSAGSAAATGVGFVGTFGILALGALAAF